jgi:hypothetical protein
MVATGATLNTTPMYNPTPAPLPAQRRGLQLADVLPILRMMQSERLGPEVMPAGTPAAAIAAQPLGWARQPTGDLSAFLGNMAPTGEVGVTQTQPNSTSAPTTDLPDTYGQRGMTGSERPTRSVVQDAAPGGPFGNRSGVPATARGGMYDILKGLGAPLLAEGPNAPGGAAPLWQFAPGVNGPQGGVSLGAPPATPGTSLTGPLQILHPPARRGGNGDSRSGYAGGPVAESGPAAGGGGGLGPVDMSIAGPVLSGVSLLGGPIGLAASALGALGGGYNTWASDQLAGQLGGGLSWDQVLGGLFGFNRYGQGTYTGAPFNLLDPNATWEPTPGFVPGSVPDPQWAQDAVRDARARGGSGDYARENERMFGSATGAGTGALY